MRVPHTIPEAARRAFRPSGATYRLDGEAGRRLRADDEQWDHGLAPRLSTLVLAELAGQPADGALAAWAALRGLGEDDLHCHALHLLELLPADLPLADALPALPDGVYWQRRAEHAWPDGGNFPQYHGGSWKRLVAERTLQDTLERLDPESFDDDELRGLLQAVAPSVLRLHLRELKRGEPFVIPDHPADTYVPDPENWDHLDFVFVLRHLPGLQELSLSFNKRDMGEDFDLDELKVSLDDCQRLGQAVSEHGHALTTLRVRRSLLDDLRTAMLLRPLQQSCLTTLDLSHCQLRDQGAMAVAALLAKLPSLAAVVLVNNKIGSQGARGLAFAMADAEFLGERLDLRLNPIGDLGGQFVAALLRRNLGPRALGLAATGMASMAGLHLAEALHSNCRVQDLDVSCNPGLGEHGGAALAEAMAANTALLQLDMRDIGALDQHAQQVQEALAANRERHRQVWEQQQRQQLLQEMQEQQELQELQASLLGSVRATDSRATSSDQATQVLELSEVMLGFRPSRSRHDGVLGAAQHAGGGDAASTSLEPLEAMPQPA